MYIPDPTENRLEYSQKYGMFHFENPKKDNKYTNTYVSICDSLIAEDCLEFAEMMDKKHKEQFENESYPTVAIIKKEFTEYQNKTERTKKWKK